MAENTPFTAVPVVPAVPVEPKSPELKVAEANVGPTSEPELRAIDPATPKQIVPEPLPAVTPEEPGPASKERQLKMIHGDNGTGEPVRNGSPMELLVGGSPEDELRQNAPWEHMIHGDPKDGR